MCVQSRPRRARQLAAWLQALVLAHTAYLIAAPGALASSQQICFNEPLFWQALAAVPSIVV